MTSASQARRARDLRRRQAHACPSCRRMWALRGARHPAGGWLLLCVRCDWRRVVGGTSRAGLAV